MQQAEMSDQKKVNWNLTLLDHIRDGRLARETQSRLLLFAQFAIAIRNMEALPAIVKHIKCIDVPTYGKTLLMNAACLGNFEAARYLVEEAGIDVNATDINGNGAYEMAVSKGHEDIEQLLLDSIKRKSTKVPTAL